MPACALDLLVLLLIPRLRPGSFGIFNIAQRVGWLRSDSSHTIAPSERKKRWLP